MQFCEDIELFFKKKEFSFYMFLRVHYYTHLFHNHFVKLTTYHFRHLFKYIMN